MKKVLIADDHEIIRRGVRMSIERFPNSYHFIEASTRSDVVRILSSQDVSYAVIDMFLADGNIFSDIQQIFEHSNRVSILVYTMSAEEIYARRFMEKGARGFVSKQSSISELEKALQTVFDGDIYLSAAIKDSFFRKTVSSGNPIDSLSDRELEVAEYLVMGTPIKEIALKMKLDATTISTYRKRALEKLQVENSMQLKDKFLLYKNQA